MRALRILALGVGAAVVAASALAVVPASAASYSFVSAIPPVSAGPIVSSVDISVTSATILMVAHTQGVEAENLGFAAFFEKQASLNGGGAFGILVNVSGGAATYSSQAVASSGSSIGPAGTPDGVVGAVDVAGQTISLSIPRAAVPYPDPLWVFGTIDQAGDSNRWGAAYTGTDIVGLGPVRSAPAVTSTAVTLTWPTQVRNGTPVTIIAKITPAEAPGAIQFVDGGTVIASGAVAAGSAVLTLPSSLSLGTHALTVEFVPSDASNFAPSSTTATVNVITTATPTRTALTLSKKSQTFKKSPATATAVVAWSPPGSVTFKDGTKTIATVPLRKGKASVTLPKSLKKGKHSITAVFVPTNADAFAPSTSKKVVLKVTK